jgi:hypothetical protein
LLFEGPLRSGHEFFSLQAHPAETDSQKGMSMSEFGSTKPNSGFVIRNRALPDR